MELSYQNYLHTQRFQMSKAARRSHEDAVVVGKIYIQTGVVICEA